MTALLTFTTLIVFIVITGVVYAVVQRASIRAATRPNEQLAQAARLLDQVLASDNAVPQLPTVLRNQVNTFVSNYYKEIQK